MAKPKLYLSAAAHAVDNPTKCPIPCGENVHCIQYMDLVEIRMKELGADVMRNFRTQTGTAATRNRVAEANKWGADLYYVAHTNAGGGRYSMTMCYKDAASKKKANVFKKYRKCVSSHKVTTRTDLYEINATKMVCLYDELFFHDNADDCAWFHNGGMELLVEETCLALCELLELKYKAPGKPEVKPAKAHKAGDVVKLNKGKLYLSSTGKTAVTRTGTFYLYDGVKVKNRYRVTNKANRVGKKPLALYVSGWVELQ